MNCTNINTKRANNKRFNLKQLGSMFLMMVFLLFGSAQTAFGQDPAEPANVLGPIDPPQGVKEYNIDGNIGIINFSSSILRVVTIGAGVWVMFNIFIAGFKLVTGFGNTKMFEEARDQITWSIIGLVIIALAYTIAGIAGLLLFGKADFIINPQLYSINDV
jgi:hypothetical protein